MRRSIPFAGFLPLCVHAVAAGEAQRGLNINVDPRIELVSIVFRLAGSPEYNTGRLQAYTSAVDAHFGSFRNHRAVEMARRLRHEQSISFDSCMSLAVHIADVNHFQARVPLIALESRWTIQTANAFLDELRRFAVDAEFGRFFQVHRNLYARSEQRMLDLLQQKAHLEWFEEFFGPTTGASFYVVLGMLNGGGNYGVRFADSAGKEDLYAIIGVAETDQAGLPVFGQETLELLVHEFTHSFVNHVVQRHAQALEPAGQAMYAVVADAMAAQAYGNWKTMLDELFVRAAVVRYGERSFGGEVAAAGSCGSARPRNCSPATNKPAKSIQPSNPTFRRSPDTCR